MRNRSSLTTVSICTPHEQTVCSFNLSYFLKDPNAGHLVPNTLYINKNFKFFKSIRQFLNNLRYIFTINNYNAVSMKLLSHKLSLMN